MRRGTLCGCCYLWYISVSYFGQFDIFLSTATFDSVVAAQDRCRLSFCKVIFFPPPPRHANGQAIRHQKLISQDNAALRLA